MNIHKRLMWTYKNFNRKQQLRRIIPQKYLRAPIKIHLGWTTIDTMQQFSWGIRNSYRLISSKVANYKKGKNSETTDQNKADINVKYIFEDKDSLKGKAM